MSSYCNKKSNGKKVKGIITAGHKNKKGDKFYYVVSSSEKLYIGKIIGRRFSNNIDCAFIEITGTKVSITDKIKNNNGFSVNHNVVISLPIGFEVTKCGYAGGTKTGTIIYNDCYLNYENTPMDHLYWADYKTKKGDSGGIVYDPDDGTFTGIQVAVSGEADSKNFYKNSYYLDEQKVLSEWGGLKNIFVY